MVTIERRGTKWLAAGLLVSLALNVFIGGLVVGRVMNAGPPRQGAAGPGFQLNGPIARIAQSLPAEQRPAFVRAIEPHRGALASAGQEIREARIKLGEATIAEPFDRASFIASANQLDTRSQTQRKAFYEALGDGLAVLPVDVRRDILASARQSGASLRRRGP